MIGRNRKREAVSERTCVQIIINQPQSDFDKPLLYGHTNKCRQTNRFACMCTPTLTPTQMSRCDLVCSAAVSSLQSVGLIASSSPTELGSAPTQSVTQHRHGRHDTTSVTLAFAFGRWRSSGGKSKSVDICDRSQADSFSDSHFAYPTVFLFFPPPPLFAIPHSFFLFLFSHNLSASLIVKQPVCSCALLCSSTTIFVGFLVSNSAS